MARKTKSTQIRKTTEAQLGDYVEIEGIDSGASWRDSPQSPDRLKLSKLRWSGELVRNDGEVVAVDGGGTIEDEEYAQRHEYHFLWAPSVTNIKVIRKAKKNRR